MSLREYGRRRDFARTIEPRPGKSSRNGSGRFVVQKHRATRLHYDFRLELKGALKSWAVPKGIPYSKGDKRLAVQVEDHPVEYIDFEGTIPKGQYGGGTVMVWDKGTFEILGKNTLEQGKLHVRLRGKKLAGEWHLVQMRGGKEWLLIRAGCDMPAVSRKLDNTSAASGRSMDQIAQGTEALDSTTPRVSANRKAGRRRASPPKFLEPMKAKPVRELPSGEQWTYEVKLDGYRALAIKDGPNVHLLSRNEKDISAKLPGILEEVGSLPASDCIIDGEIVALDSKGRSSFQLLQSMDRAEEGPPVFYYAFDLLRLDGKDLQTKTLEERKAKLEVVLQQPFQIIRYSPSLPGPASELISKVNQLGLEGLIAKRRDSTYESGARSGAWVKWKRVMQQEMVIGGYTDPGGSRDHFGALLVGYFKDGRLQYGGKVGTGFAASGLRQLHQALQRIPRSKCPFANLPEVTEGRYGQRITGSRMKRCHWVKPVLVCQVKSAEWTRDGKLRQPVFLGLRNDKKATEVVRELV